jgi:ferredoxin-thioredoxin reductase catalytic chain
MGDDMKKVIEGYERYAKSQGFRLNPDRKIVETIVKGIFNNQEKHGARYCPCRMVTGDKEKDKLIICPCAYHKKELEEMGHCHCRLFVR